MTTALVATSDAVFCILMLGSSPKQKSRQLFVDSTNLFLLYFVAGFCEYPDYFPNAFY
jgi:hypothetical protein